MKRKIVFNSDVRSKRCYTEGLEGGENFRAPPTYLEKSKLLV